MRYWYWWVFGGLIAVLLFLDLCVFHRHARRESLRRSLLWSAFWSGVGLAFGVLVWAVRGHDGAMAYFTAYLIEKSLSIDNLFVFLALFGYFAVPPENQHRVLFWGILGAIITRGLFIFGGVALLTLFHWLIYPLGAVLIFTGGRLAFGGDTEVNPEKNPIIRFASRTLPFTPGYHGESFAVITREGLRFTPLILVLIAIETTDIVFAVDSVPAALAVSRDAFVIFTSNIFAILGLRALYFVLAGTVLTMRFLRPALAIILVLIGVKMILARWVEVPTAASLIGVAAILGGAVALSVLRPGKREDGAKGA
jgi:tellurite resistance protein TerC